MMSSALSIIDVHEVHQYSEDLVGQTALRYAELNLLHLSTLPGFVITTKAYDQVLRENQFDAWVDRELTQLRPKDIEAIQDLSTRLQEKIRTAQFPDELAQDCIQAYLEFGNNARVKVSPSVPLGQVGIQAKGSTFQGEANVINAVRELWASCLTARFLSARIMRGEHHIKFPLAILVQHVPPVEKSGMVYSIGQRDHDKKLVTIRGVYGELHADQMEQAAEYVIQKENWSIELRKPNVQQEVWLWKNGSVQSSPINHQQELLHKNECIALAQAAISLQKHFFFPQQAKWILHNGELFIESVTPFTALQEIAHISHVTPLTQHQTEQALVLQGHTQGESIVTGLVRIIHTEHDLPGIQAGEILAMPSALPSAIPYLKHVHALIIEHDSPHSQLVEAARLLGLPCITQAQRATTVLHTGQHVKILSRTGQVFTVQKQIEQKESIPVEPKQNLATKIYVNPISLQWKNIGVNQYDGVCSISGASLLQKLGVHPKKILSDHHQKVFAQALQQEIKDVIQRVGSLPVLYRPCDLRTNEYQQLLGGRQMEQDEPNPILGFHGSYRLHHDSDFFREELHVLAEILGKQQHKSLGIILPFVRCADDVRAVLKVLRSAGVGPESGVKIWIEVAAPYPLITMDQIWSPALSGVVMNMDSLVQLIHATNLDNEQLLHMQQEQRLTWKWILETMQKQSAKQRIPVFIQSKMFGASQEYVELAVQAGATGIIVNDSSWSSIRENVMYAERARIRGGA